MIFLDEKPRFTFANFLHLFIQGPPLTHSAVMNFSEESCQDFSNDSTILAIDSFRTSYIPTISIIGCLGNVLSLIVLAKINDCFHRLLFVLACIDLMVPLLCTLLLLLDQLQQGKMDVLQIIPNALLEAGFSGSGWMTVSISFERFSSFVLTLLTLGI